MTTNPPDDTKPTVTVERVRELLKYDPETGLFTWRVNRGRIKAGDQAGTVLQLGRTEYVYIMIDHRQYRAHRLAWLYVNGTWPEDMLDHINGNGSDNRYQNLRPATCAQNSQAPNKRMLPQNTSGYVGVSRKVGRSKWNASIAVSGRRIFLGAFATPEQANEAYQAAKKKHHAFMETV